MGGVGGKAGGGGAAGGGTAGAAYAYVAGIGPFSNAPYSEENLLTGLLRNSADIRSAAYEIAFAFSVAPRDEDATPFVPVADPNAAAQAAAYARDVERMREAGTILSNLRVTKSYPASLASLKPKYGTIDVKDPNGSVYGYRVVSGGTDFALTVAFETSLAIQAVTTSRRYSATSTPIAGQTVTFTKDSYQSTLYLPRTPPKTYFEQLANMVKSIPAEMNVTASLGGTTNFGAQRTDWKFNVTGAGDFGDLAYALDVDVLKKGTDYYFRLNKIPSLFLGGLDLAKGEWVQVDSTATSSTRSFIPLPSVESSYKTQRAEIAALLVDVARIAEEEGIFTFRSTPRQETIKGRTLYRYDLRLAKDAIEPMNARLKALMTDGKYPWLIPYVSTPTLSAAPATPEARDAVYDYYDKNARLIVWVDREGRPAIAKSTMRIVPPEEAKQLAGKQINVEVTLTLDDINEPVVIEAPANAKSFEDLMSERE